MHPERPHAKRPTQNPIEIQPLRRRLLSLPLLPWLLGSGLPAGAATPAAAADSTDPGSANEAGPWLDAARPSRAARQALALLAAAAEDGLAPRDYGLPALQAMADAAGPAAPGFAPALERALVRFARDLQRGRIEPQRLGFRVPARPAAPDYRRLLREAAAREQLPEAIAALRPGLGQYQVLREALARYRVLAAGSQMANQAPTQARTQAPALPAGKPIEPGAPLAAAAELQRFLSDLGDMATAAPDPAGRYDGALVEGLRRFQQRHGLAPDGVIGARTRAALAVPLAQRVQQLELALERLRWLPDLGREAFIGINIPMFRLWAWDPAAPDGPEALLSMKVVVGRALNTQTPVLAEELRYLVFRPYWNVPRSILLKELLPELRRDPAALARQDLEIVRGPGDDARVLPLSAAALAGLASGELRLRQRPGPRNSLGLLKFIFPNDANVYLHGTPATALFERARRDFSHGCVRVEDPVALAEWLLRSRPGWDRAAIEAAMQGEAPLQLDLKRPLPVLLFYLTAMVMPGEHEPRFAEDIYGHDAKLARALTDHGARTAP